MKKTIAVLPGDGIGPEVTAAAVEVLRAVAARHGHGFAFDFRPFGGCAIDATGVALPEDTLSACRAADAVLLGAVGGPEWNALPADRRPERGGLLPLRKELGLFCNLRPAVLHEALRDASPLRRGLTEGGIDLVVVRELTGGIYFGERGAEGAEAWDVMRYSEGEVARIARKAFALARTRRGKVTNVDKHNVLASSRLWRATVERVGKEEFADVALDHLYVDNAAQQLVRDPKAFDVVLTGNLFGDILSDEAAAIAGSLGMLPSASLREDSFGLYEPIHGSAPDIAGKGVANPLAAILSAAMMLRHSFALAEEAGEIERAVETALARGIRTPDIASPGGKTVGTGEMTSAVLAALS